METIDNRFEKGWNKLLEIDGEQGKKVVDSLQELAPDFVNMLIGFPFGEVYSRPELNLRTREIVTVSALAAMGTAALQLKVHLNGALNVGCSQKELVEIMIQIAVYAGFPAAINGLASLKEVLSERREEDEAV